MSVDQRLRNGLRDSVADVDPDPHAALSRVEARARRATRASRWARGALAVAACAAGLALVPPLIDWARDGDRPNGVSEGGLTGTYVVDVADTAPARTAQLTGRWVITFEDNGVLDLNPPPGYDGTTAGTSYEIDAQTLRTNALIDHLGCQASGDTVVGTYEWQLREDRLEFELVRDDCQARVELFTGQMWSRAP